jgi:O-antigen ligase
MDALRRLAGKNDMLNVLQIKSPADGGVAAARFLLLGVVVMMLVSPSAAIGFELASYIVFACAPGLRRRLVTVVRHPVMIGFLPFAAVIIVATFYGAASWHDAWSALIGWRKMLLLPLALALFDDAASKRLALKTVVVTCLAGALVSFLAVTVLTLPGWPGVGVVFRNYATQGIAFSLAIVICGTALMRPEAFAGDWLLGDRRIMAAAAVALLVDIVFVLTGRSGYVSVIVMGAAIVALLARGSWRAKAVSALGVLICIGIVFASSAHVRGRVGQALSEIESVDQVVEGTSLGQRVVMWRNTVRMIRDHPIFGVGTGGFQDGYRPYVQGVSGWQGNESGDPHNQFLKIQGEQGIVGLAAFLFFIFRVLTCPAPSPYRELAVAALVGWCATSLASSHFSTFTEGRLLFFWIGAMLANRTDLIGAKLHA